MKTRLLTFVLCTILCSNLFSQSAAVWSNGLVSAIAQVDSTEVFSQEGKPYLRIWSSDRLVYSDYADSLQFLPVGEDVVIPVTSVTLDQTSASLKAGETITLTATVNPDDATDKTVTWSTTDATVATVDNGVVTAKKVGTATITAKAGDKTATCEITVVATPVTSITLNRTSASLKVDETVTLTATVSPDDATDKTVIWNTSDNSIASVSNGVVTANRIGNVTITASSADGTKKATCSVKVYSENPESGGNEDISIEDWD